MQNIQAFQNQLPKLGEHVYIHPNATIIGEVEIGQDSSVWPGVVVRGDVNHIHIGHGTNVQDLSVLHVSHKSS
jgi:carbonic anhydrase/acetyltransferase-like protein (isoleucine patch superfamily)|tara:strand:- start:6 stop:224 length:219 start_codon:yes stop_codon:yes gene_type:complete